MLSRSAGELDERGIVTVVPSFGALAAVQDKAAAGETLARLGLPQPPSTSLVTAADLAAWEDLPVYVKTPIGTASTGTYRVEDRDGLAALAHELDEVGAFERGGVVAQRPVDGPLVMVQTVFDDGALVAAHANLRVREGAGGGASHKRSVAVPEAVDALDVLGRALGWPGPCPPMPSSAATARS